MAGQLGDRRAGGGRAAEARAHGAPRRGHDEERGEPAPRAHGALRRAAGAGWRWRVAGGVEVPGGQVVAAGRTSGGGGVCACVMCVRVWSVSEEEGRFA